MSEQFSAEVSNRICEHMNSDHADAVVLYAQTFGGLAGDQAAEMVSIDFQGMNLTAQVNGAAVPIRVEFDRVLQDAEDAHHTLIAMVKQARSKSKDSRH